MSHLIVKQVPTKTTPHIVAVFIRSACSYARLSPHLQFLSIAGDYTKYSPDRKHE